MSGPPEIASVDLHRVRARLQARLVVLETQLATQGDPEAAWTEFVQTLDVFLRVEDRIHAQAPAERFLSTKEMADRLGISVRCLLGRKKKGHVRPSIAHGKALRWRPEDALR